MKGTYILKFLSAFLIGALLFSCRKKNVPPDDKVDPVTESNEIIAIPEDGEVTITETEPVKNADYLAFIIETGDEQKEADIKPGAVIVTNGQIVLVTSVNKESGNALRVEGPRGDLRYIFHDTSFSLKPGEVKSTKAPFEFEVWSGEKSAEYSDVIFSKNTSDSKQLLDYKINATIGSSLKASIDFEFHDTVTEWYDGIAFALSKNFDVTATLTGNVYTSADLSVDYSIDDDLHFVLSKYTDPTILLKHDLFDPYRDIILIPVGDIVIPVIIHIGCDAYAELDLTAHGEMHFTMGADAGATGMIGYKYDGVTGEKKKVNPGLVPHFDRHDPTISGKGVVSAKFTLWPHVYCWLEYTAGFYTDVRPYARADFGVGFSKDLIGYSTSDYVSNATNVYVGVDWEAGLSFPLDLVKPGISYEWDWTKFFGGNIAEAQVVKSPAGLVLDYASGSNFEVGGIHHLDFRVLADYYGTLARSVFKPVVKIEIPSRSYAEYFLADLVTGQVGFNWRPEKRGEELIASVYDIDGNVVGRLQFQSGVGETTLYVITGSAQSVTADSAVIPVEFKAPNAPVAVGVVYSSYDTNPKVGAPGCQTVETAPSSATLDITLTGLSENTLYNVRAYLNMGEDIFYADPITFTTAASSYGLEDVSGENY